MHYDVPRPVFSYILTKPVLKTAYVNRKKTPVWYLTGKNGFTDHFS